MLGNKNKITLYKDIKKPKPGEILFFPNDNRLAEVPPYINNANNIPSWFRKIPRKKGSVRSCSGTLDYLQIGVTIPMWTNLKFEPNLNNPYRWDWAADRMPFAENYVIEGFRYESTGKCPMTEAREIEDGLYPKLVNPWCAMTAPGWSTLVLPPLYEPNKNYQLVPAIVHTDFYHTLNAVLNIYTDKSFTIQAGTPLMHLIPFKRNIPIEKMEIMPEEYYKLVHARGFGKIHRFPGYIGTGQAYKTYQRQVDDELSNQEEKKWFFQKKK